MLLITILSLYEMARAPAEGGLPFFRVKEFNAMNTARPDFTAMFLTGHILDGVWGVWAFWGIGFMGGKAHENIRLLESAGVF